MILTNDKYEVILIGGSAGSIRVLKNILKSLTFVPKIPIIVGLHRLQTDTSAGLRTVIQFSTDLPVIEPVQGQKIENSKVYIAPANRHLIVEYDKTLSLSESPLVHYSRPSIDTLFLSAAEVFQDKIIGILLTGANKDGAYGIKMIAENGGKTIVQHPDDCFINTMTKAAIEMTEIDHILTAQEIASFLNNFFDENK
ncbi:MAG: chemotaxis protein CheB [Bacteroidetes bacterium]|nr:MAG: chemotaxis protein CheB [Bacteroidota bacterium]